jgi:hypothetical protein
VFAQDCTGTDAIVLAASISITQDLSIDGAGHRVSVDGGNAVRVFSIGPAIAVRLTGLTIEHGTAVANFGSGGEGGGILNNGALTLSNSTLRDNRASSFGGGIDNGKTGTLTVTHSILSGNNVGAAGGGIANFGTLTVTDSTLSGNNSDTAGGGIENYGRLTVTTSTLASNATNFASGGGIDNFGTLTVTTSTLSGNTASATGGGIANGAGTVTVTNSTLAGNTAGSAGGGIANLGTRMVTSGGIATLGTLTVTHSTLSGNRVTGMSVTGMSDRPIYGGGGLYNGQSTVTLVNTIVAGNTATGGATDPDIGGSTVDTVNSRNNLIGDASSSGGLTDGTNGNRVGVADPGLGTLGDYGGATETMALLPGSPALDAIANANHCGTGEPAVDADQRGLPRPQPPEGQCDIGASESGSSAVSSTGGTSETAVGGTASSLASAPERILPNHPRADRPEPL